MKGPAASQPRRRGTGVLWAVLLLAGVGLLQADTVDLLPVADTTLAEVAPNNNFGGADSFNAGTAGNRRDSRALVRFDLTSLPAGAVLTSAQVVFDLSRQPLDGLEPSAFELHRALVSWGEGVGVPDPGHPGRGAPALPGEATWLTRFAGTGLNWSAPGGAPGVDFVGDSSGELPVIGVNDSPYMLAGAPGVLADVEFWRANPAANFGWFWLSGSEGIQYTARSFYSREGVNPPVLRLEYTIPEPTAAALLTAGLAALVWRRRP